MPVKNWKAALNHFLILFENRQLHRIIYSAGKIFRLILI